MSLHVESQGYGAPLVMLHGWGMHGGIWGGIVPQLAQNFRVHCVDLPGHGYSKEKGEGSPRKGEADGFPTAPPLPVRTWEKGNGEPEVFPFPLPPSPFHLDYIVDQLSARFTEPLTLCGWSLGGLVALRWAQLTPQQVQRLVLISSTPCFVERDDWLFGMAQETLRQFAAELERDHAATLRRFLALQVRGSEQERELLSMLRECLFSRGEPDRAALRGGLEILRDADLRGELASIRQPALVIAGERDRLTPPEAGLYMAQALPNARAVEIAGAAHTPFLSHPQVFLQHIKEFLA